MIRIDATLTECYYSDKECAAGNVKGGYGHHRLTAWCDNSAELLGITPRKGNAGSNTASDHIAIIDAAIGQIPADGWSPALDAKGGPRQHGQVAELTGLPRESTGGDRLAGWPTDMQILVRRERIEAATELSLFEQLNGFRYQVIATATGGGQVQLLEARHRVHARVEGFIRCGKDTGLARWPSHSFVINTAWVIAAALAIDLLCWMRLPLFDGDLAKAEPATLHYRLLHAAARLVRRSRYLVRRVPET